MRRHHPLSLKRATFGPDGGWGAKGSYLGRARSLRPIQAAVALWRGIKLDPTAGRIALRGGTALWECQRALHKLMFDKSC